MNEPQPHKELILLAREYRGLSQAKAAEIAGIPAASLSRYETGVRVPHDADLKKIADALDFPPNFFTQKFDERSSGTCTEIYHRKRKTTRVGLVRQINGTAGVLALCLRHLSRFVDLEPRREFPRMDLVEFDGNVKLAARHLRATWRVPPGRIGDLVALAESAGALILTIPFASDHMDAISLWPHDMPPVILLNSTAPGDRLRFSLAHEIAHLVLHEVPSVNAEEEANEFAGEFLMPDDEVKASLRQLTIEKAVTLKAEWLVSLQAIVHRAKSLEMIKPWKARSLYQAVNSSRLRINGGFEVAREKPNLVSSIVKLYREDLSYTDEELQSLMRIGDAEFQRFFGVPSFSVVSKKLVPRRNPDGSGAAI